MKKIFFAYIINIILTGTGFSQIIKVDSVSFSPIKMERIKINKPSPYYNDYNYPALAGVGLITGTSIYKINEYYKNTWWRKQATEFKFVNDWNYALWIDKFGHFYGTFLIAHGFSAGLEAGDIDYETSVWLAALGAFGMQLYVEIQDGYGPNWGFSPGDVVSDFLGAGYSVMTYYYPYLKNFQPRASYYPSQEMLNGQKKDNNISDDYEGQKLWLSFRMKNLLPEKLAEYWPSFLMLSVGYGVSQLNGAGGGIKKFYIAFDFDAEEIPLHGRGWQFIKNTLNYIHFPLPGIQLTPKFNILMFAY